MPFVDRCSREFSEDVKQRGKRYFQERRVNIVSVADKTICAVVSGNSNYEVMVDWNEASSDDCLEASCTCPYFEDNGLCKHIWATMLAADAKGVGPASGKRRLYVVEANGNQDDEDEDDEDDDDEDLDDDWIPHRRGSASRARSSELLSWLQFPAPRPSRAPGWRSQLAEALEEHLAGGARGGLLLQFGKMREAWYVIDVGANVYANDLTIQLFHRETKLNGEFGKLKPLSVSRQGIDQFPRPDDREMLSLLLANDEGNEEDSPYHYSYYGYEPKVSDIVLASRAYDQVLPKLCATGRLVWTLNSSQQSPAETGRPVTWDDGPPWRFHLRIEPDEKKKRSLLEGQLLRDGQPPVPLKTPALVLGDGLVLHDDRLSRLDCGGFSTWIGVLRRSDAISVPHRDRWEFLRKLWQSRTMPDISLPADLRCEPVRVAPQARLMVRSADRYRKDQFNADVEFRYDGTAVRAADRSAGIVDENNERVLVRDRAKEDEFLAMLGPAGARSADSSYSREHDVWIPRQRFPALAEKLIQGGWIVEAEGHLFRKAGECRLNVTSGVDWFDLEGDCEFEGQIASLPDLLQALRHGEKYVRLGDGSHGLLPQEWLDKFAPLANLGSVEEDRIRFRQSQALVLDALLAAQKEVSVDEQFAHIRNKLRSFAGVSPHEEPQGFTGQLRAYQKEGLGWLHFLRDFRLGGCLADDMGLGKTIQVLALLQTRRTASTSGHRPPPSLAVVPRSLVFNWIEESRRFTPDLRVLDYTGLLRREALERLDEYDLVVTTYGTLHRDVAKLKDLRFDYVILDEAQAIKNAQAQRAKACRLLQADHRLALTGTPVENHLGELWSIFEFLNPGMLGSSSAFQGISSKVTQDKENLELLRRALAPFILRRTKGQVLAELPEKTEQTLYCDLEGKQQKRYHELRDFYRAAISKRIEQTGLAKAKIHVLEALLRLRQAACHPGLIDKQQADQPSAKVDALMEQLREVTDEGHKALVFSQFTSFLAIVRQRLDAEGIVYEYLDGRTRQRQQRVERFQNDPACPLFLISLKAGGHGLNLTAADYVFILDPWWNPAVEAQAIDRAHRIGQSRRVFAYRLIARDTVEEKILELQKTKRDLADAIVSADSSVLRNLTAEDLEMLLT